MISGERMNKNIKIKSKFRGIDETYTYDELYSAKIYRYYSIHEIQWDFFLSQPDIPVRIILWEGYEALPVDFLFIPRANTNLLVGFHGAENRERVELPKFQFVNSFKKQRTESLVFFFDSTLLLDKTLSLGWMVGNQSEHFLSRIIHTLQYLIKICNYNKTTLVGHSGGGFASIAVGSQISNSHAVSVNGQVYLGVHQPYTVQKLYERVFPEEPSVEAMMTKYQERMDIRKLLDKRVENSRFTYFSHKNDSSYTRFPHFKLLANYMGISETGGSSVFGDKIVLCNWKVTGDSAHALPGTVIPFINFALGENLKMDLGMVD